MSLSTYSKGTIEKGMCQICFVLNSVFVMKSGPDIRRHKNDSIMWIVTGKLTRFQSLRDETMFPRTESRVQWQRKWNELWRHCRRRRPISVIMLAAMRQMRWFGRWFRAFFLLLLSYGVCSPRILFFFMSQFAGRSHYLMTTVSEQVTSSMYSKFISLSINKKWARKF